MSYQNRHFRLGMGVIYALSVYFIFGIASCNSGGNDNKPLEAIKSDTTESPKVKAFLGNGNFAYLAIEKATLNHIFNSGHGDLNAKKIVFRFSHDGNANSSIVIDGFPTHNNNVEYTGTIVSLKPAFSNASKDLSGKKIYLSDLELTNAQYVILSHKSNDDNDFLVFIPFVGGPDDPNYPNAPKIEHYVTYDLHWMPDPTALTSGIPKILAGGDVLNPCPPNQPGQ